MIRDNGHSKHEILSRMRRITANLFSVSYTELLDPVVNLFLESLSEEVYKISGEIENIENRILDKLLSILVPSTETIAKPAHCILHAYAQDGITELTTESGFYYSDRKQNQRFSFYPVCNTRIYNGAIQYFIHKGTVYSIGRDLSKTVFSRSNHRNRFDDNTFWMGLELDDNIKDISGLSFYFDLYAIYNKEEYLNLLPYTIWSIGDDTLVMNKGIFSEEKKSENITLQLFSKYELSTKINQMVINQYSDHFMTIANECLISDKKEYFPTKLVSDFPENISEKIGKPLVWIKVTCPHRFTSEIIDALQPSINAFPVLNKELISKITEVNRAIPIIPINTEGSQSFLSVHNVNDSVGTKYYDIPINDIEHDFGIYAVRRGGIERYSKQDAGEYLANTIDTLNNEVSSFFKNRNDIKSDLKKIENQVTQLISDLKKKRSELNVWSEVENYLLVNSSKENDIYFIDYWVTNGKDANHIKPGSLFTTISDLSVKQTSVYSLSATKGGEYAPLGEKKKDLYKQSLTQHKLLVTDKDISEFCLKEFEESISEVKVSGGFMTSSDPRLGFIETTDVYLMLLKHMENLIGEKDSEYFYQALKKNSPSTFNYRIFINNTLLTPKAISI
ncbi:MAG: hypothetical protein ACK5KT_06035 [Dysgonomonas sp.]